MATRVLRFPVAAALLMTATIGMMIGIVSAAIIEQLAIRIRPLFLISVVINLTSKRFVYQTQTDAYNSRIHLGCG